MKRNPRPFRQMDSHRFITRIDHTAKNIMTLCKDLILVWKLYLQLTQWSSLLREKLTGPQLVKKFSVFYGACKFITAFTSVRHLSLFSAVPIQSISPLSISWRSILVIYSHLLSGLAKSILPSGRPTKPLYVSSLSPDMLHALPIVFLCIWEPE